jgi:hypothetical protein
MVYRISRPGREPKPGQSQGLALAQAQLGIEEVKYIDVQSINS